ncbi:hypothetical protein ABZV80_43955 [Streptomyces sp. NPDC005132]|uniref:hypothetical protein n=1 Tax=Streptomyces sp. NPDC005132 TaxID=3154294 RepID=UPI0033A7A1F2
MATAVHEAGHAVVAMVSGIHVPSLVIKTTVTKRSCGAFVKEFSGANERLDLDKAPDRRTAVVVLAAGERAEVRWLRDQGLWTATRAWAVEIGALNDQALARDIFGYYFGVDMQYGTSHDGHVDGADYWHYGSLAELILVPLWDQVLRIAGALNERERLTGDEAAAFSGLLNPACP